MTRSQFTGYEIAKSLSESDSPDLDTNAIDNLGGIGISNDLLLFYNNLRNFSSIEVSNANIIADTIYVPSKNFIFTNGTKLVVNGSIYYVKDYDTVNRFRLSTNSSLVSTVSVPPTGTYIRSDAVTLDNLKMLSKERKYVLDDITDSDILIDIEDAKSVEEIEKLYTSLIAMMNSADTSSNSAGISLRPTSISEYYSKIDENIATVNYYKNNAIIRNRDFNSTNEIVVSGVIRIVDTAGLNETGLSANSNPGTFIANPLTGETVRSFLLDDNIWTAVGNNLVSSAPAITIGSLNFTGNNGIEFNEKTPGIFITEIANTANIAFTHSVDVTIDGEIYALCLTFGT